ncbi:MAG: hypothetical protein HON68_00855 [Gammaproteobacteria bacterium]|jgi:hypothetical protein|nr:hypothetical protein [Gammaproteobacteria bacterium]MBT3489470.1 hypothetical protein [Gammaproteobacteria bacterium]MBT3718626.1 hypothetical protein [Gammaproteobacteria bacterium]MBT3844779.1 hypothetical protein [Gammaproteobacteria bacterium]MBT3892810.1 hypothetical protein [Gammaproteobacteria bacterium]
MFTKLWHSWKARSESRANLDRELHKFVSAINPQLLQSAGYPNQYRSAMQKAIQYVEALTTEIPGPVAMTHEHFNNNPLVHALFASARELTKNLHLSIAMKQYTPPQPGEQCMFAVMGVRWDRIQRYGIEQQGGVLRSDVPQQAINFKDHTFIFPAASENEARQLLQDHFLKRLANEVRESIQSLEQQRQQLFLQGKKMEGELRQSNPPDREQPQREIEQLWKQWRELSQRLDINNTIGHFEQIMRDPAQYLRLEPYQLSIDSMGIERPPSEGGETLNLVNLYGADRRIWTVMLVQFFWQRPPTAEEQIEQAYRWLTIS